MFQPNDALERRANRHTIATMTELHDVGRATPAAQRLGGLSAREAQILGLVSTGLTNTTVAAQLGITVHAVKFHLAGVYRKLGVGNRTEATFLYLSTQTNGSGEH